MREPGPRARPSTSTKYRILHEIVSDCCKIIPQLLTRSTHRTIHWPNPITVHGLWTIRLRHRAPALASASSAYGARPWRRAMCRPRSKQRKTSPSRLSCASQLHLHVACLMPFVRVSPRPRLLHPLARRDACTPALADTSRHTHTRQALGGRCASSRRSEDAARGATCGCQASMRDGAWSCAHV